MDPAKITGELKMQNEIDEKREAIEKALLAYEIEDKGCDPGIDKKGDESFDAPGV